MKRRKFLYSAIGIAGTTALGSCGLIFQNKTQPNINWQMATSWPKSLDIKYGAAEFVCQRVSEMTNGRFLITPYPANEIVPALKVLNAVENGTVECGHTDSFYYIDKSLALAFGTGVPFGLNARQQDAWLYEGGGLEAMQEIYAEFGVINFPAGNSGVQMGGWFKKQINSVADMKGLKMRIPGLGGEVMKQLGVDVRRLAGGEIYQAMRNNEIDAAEWIGPYEDERLRLNEVAAFYYYPGWWEPGSSDEVQVNRARWAQLSDEYQEIFKAACTEANLRTIARYDKLNRSALRRIIAGGTKLTPYSQEILQVCKKKAFEIYEENASKDTTFKKVYEQWKTFREQIYQWHGVNELEFSKISFIL
ncbi:MAG: TRAP transporter substrate-binding protein [Okeania sp. SIO3B5]|uniref:TRAP transporter substrate-binding protein n=1 Tax=Okeania sp. SIO3B5 TaxID=2607811 RepID=UPI00140163A7|nr:TRAP transporter substrate-binding protein [Okeania sp. SIO3B5]NEO53740.1 TRAP transporter substrate-binding protein [Okeania sp. SIO3B5]